ncbi:hypothetical protein GOODEAATRI_004607, partial [Goodea atripinnis]
VGELVGTTCPRKGVRGERAGRLAQGVTSGLVLSGGLCFSRNGDGFQNVDSLQDLEVAAEVNLDRLNRA